MRWFVTSIHILVIGCAVSIPVAIFNGTLFSWHPTLMSMAFLGFMAEGVLTSISFRSLVRASEASLLLSSSCQSQIAFQLLERSRLREGHPCMCRCLMCCVWHKMWLSLQSI